VIDVIRDSLMVLIKDSAGCGKTHFIEPTTREPLLRLVDAHF